MRALVDADPTRIVGVRPVAADAVALLVADDGAAAGLKYVLQRGQTAGTCADHAGPRSAGRFHERRPAIVVADQMRKATRVAASATVPSERSRSPVSAGAVSLLPSSASLLPSTSSSTPRTAITWRRTYRTCFDRTRWASESSTAKTAASAVTPRTSPATAA